MQAETPSPIGTLKKRTWNSRILKGLTASDPGDRNWYPHNEKRGKGYTLHSICVYVYIYIDVLNPSYICHTHEAGCTSVSSASAGSSHTVSGRFYTITAFCSSFHHDPNKLGVLLAEAAPFHDFVCPFLKHWKSLHGDGWIWTTPSVLSKIVK